MRIVSSLHHHHLLPRSLPLLIPSAAGGDLAVLALGSRPQDRWTATLSLVGLLVGWFLSPRRFFSGEHAAAAASDSRYSSLLAGRRRWFCYGLRLIACCPVSNPNIFFLDFFSGSCIACLSNFTLDLLELIRAETNLTKKRRGGHQQDEEGVVPRLHRLGGGDQPRSLAAPHRQAEADAGEEEVLRRAVVEWALPPPERRLRQHHALPGVPLGLRLALLAGDARWSPPARERGVGGSQEVRGVLPGAAGWDDCRRRPCVRGGAQLWSGEIGILCLFIWFLKTESRFYVLVVWCIECLVYTCWNQYLSNLVCLGSL